MVNFDKTQPAPTSLATERLKKTGNYGKQDVYDQLLLDFKNKCYICEQKAPTSINIEHFEAHQGDVTKKFDWNNLFFACGHCNNTKGAQFENILDCTNPDHDVVNWMHYTIKTFPKETVEIKAKSSMVGNPTIVQTTIDLLLAVYNGKPTANKQAQADNLRRLLLQETGVFIQLLNRYYTNNVEQNEKNSLIRQIRKHLSTASAFTAFKRWIILDNVSYQRDFIQFFD